MIAVYRCERGKRRRNERHEKRTQPDSGMPHSGSSLVGLVSNDVTRVTRELKSGQHIRARNSSIHRNPLDVQASAVPDLERFRPHAYDGFALIGADSVRLQLRPFLPLAVSKASGKFPPEGDVALPNLRGSYELVPRREHSHADPSFFEQRFLSLFEALPNRSVRECFE